MNKSRRKFYLWRIISWILLGSYTLGLLPAGFNQVSAQEVNPTDGLVESSNVSITNTLVSIAEAQQVSDSCYQWVIDQRDAGSWERATWASAPTGGEVYWDSAGDGAYYAFTITEDPSWGTPISATYSWYRFIVAPTGAGAYLIVETVKNGAGTGQGWSQPSQDFSESPTHHQGNSSDVTVNGGIIRTAGGKKLGWDEFKLVKCYQQSQATPTPIPPTSTPWPTFTPTPIPPTSTPWPTFTPTPIPPTSTPWPTFTPTRVPPTNTPTPIPTATPADPYREKMPKWGLVIRNGEAELLPFGQALALYGKKNYLASVQGGGIVVSAAEVVAATPTSTPTPVPMYPVGVTYPIQGNDDAQIIWYSDAKVMSSSLAVVALGLFADDVTIVGIVDDPVAIVLLAAAGGYAVYGVYQAFYQPDTYVSGFGGVVEYSAQQYYAQSNIDTHLVGARSANPIVGDNGFSIATWYPMVDSYDPAQLRFVREMSVVEVNPAGATGVMEAVFASGMRYFAYYAYAAANSTEFATWQLAQDSVLQRTVDPGFALSGAEANWYYSTNHAESAAIMAALSGPTIETKGDGQSNGSIQLWAGVDESTMMATVGGVHIVSTYVHYFAFSVPVQVGPGQGLSRLGQSGYYYNRNLVDWACAWRMTRTIGHHKKPDKEALTVGTGLAKWEETKRLYGLTIPVAVLYTPW